MAKRTLFLLLVGLIMSQCTKTDDRILGIIDGNKVTVSQFVSYNVPKKSVSEILKTGTAEQFNSQFEQYAMIMAFAKKGDETNFFTQSNIKSKLDKDVEDIYNNYYQEYYNDKIIAPKLKKMEVSDKDLEAYRKRVQVRHILFSNKGKGADPKYVKEMTESILNDVKSGKSTFGDLSEKYSDDPGSAKSKGLIEDWIYENSPFVEPFKKAALKGSKGEIIPNVVSMFGTHIIQVEDVQNRSIKELKEQEPNLISSIQKNKETEIMNDVNAGLLNKYKDKIKVTPYPDLFSLVKAHSVNKDKVVFEIIGIKTVTVEDLFNIIFKDEASLEQASKAIIQQKIDVNAQLQQIVSQSIPVFFIYIEEAKKIGADKDPNFLDRIEYQKNMVKGNLYIESISSKYPKPATPNMNVSSQEIVDFYNQNKEAYFTQKDEKKKDVVMPLNESTKKQIENFLKSQKQQNFQEETQKKIYDVIKKEAEPLFEQYGIKLMPVVDKK